MSQQSIQHVFIIYYSCTIFFFFYLKLRLVIYFRSISFYFYVCCICVLINPDESKCQMLPWGIYKISFFFFSNTLLCLLLSSLLTGRFYWFLIFFPLSQRPNEDNTTARPVHFPAVCTVQLLWTDCLQTAYICLWFSVMTKKNAFWLSFTEVRVRVVTRGNNNSLQRVLCDLISSVGLAIRAVFVFSFSLRRLTFGFNLNALAHWRRPARMQCNDAI